MKAILTIKNGNKDANSFCRSLDITPCEYEYLNDISRRVGREYINVIIKQL